MNLNERNSRTTLKTRNIRIILMLRNALNALVSKNISSITDVTTIEPSRMLDLKERYSKYRFY